MKEIEINNIGEIIDASPIEMNVMFLGDTGVGKTQSIEKYCKEKGIYLKTLILSQLEASETLGIPIQTKREYNGKTYNVLETAIPTWVFDLAEHDNAILFLDEFLCAQPSVMNAFLNFLTQKRVGDIDLSHVKIIAATNIGNYTFEPDNNILSRFCWFYAVNNSVNEYLNDKRIKNHYEDENEREGVIFECRSLKPRCQEQLMKVSDDYLQIFYEGFTNHVYIYVHRDADINDVISNYFTPDSDVINNYTISDSNINAMCAILKQKFGRIKKWDVICDNFCNINDLNILTKIRQNLCS